MLWLRVKVVKYIDSRTHGPKSYVDIVQRPLRNESWERNEPKTAQGKKDRAIEITGKSIPGGIKRFLVALSRGSRDDKRYKF